MTQAIKAIGIANKKTHTKKAMNIAAIGRQNKAAPKRGILQLKRNVPRLVTTRSIAMFKKRQRHLSLIKRIPITEKDHKRITVTCFPKNSYEADLYDTLKIAETKREVAYWIGLSSCNGTDGVPKDEKRGFYFILIAANAGNAHAQYLIGLHFSNKTSPIVRKDTKKAAYWFEKAADQEHKEAQYYLGCYYLGYKNNYLYAQKQINRIKTRHLCI
ncbi:MAG: hypothetical protein LBS36_00955 [Oscillospiraceae bacterium]|jgi:hypothetical protein|nr:hypothetical protein [Oscillospiraceae bacterium]